MVLSSEVKGYLADFELLEKKRAKEKGPSGLASIRRAAMERFVQLGFPTTRDEEWKYTSVAPIAGTRFRPAEIHLDGLNGEARRQCAQGEGFSAQLVFVNGYYSQELSVIPRLPDGVAVSSLAVACRLNPLAVEPFLARCSNDNDLPFVTLNTAFLDDGAFVYVPRRVVIKEPIHLLFLATGHQTPMVSHPRNLIVLEESSQAALVESYVGLEPGAYFTNAVTEIAGGANSVIVHHKLNREGDGAFHIATTQARLGPTSRLVSHAISIGGSLTRNDLNVTLDGEGAECALNGLYLAADRQHIDNHTRIDHVKPRCISRQLYKGVLGGKSRGVFNGKIRVHQSAQRSDARQTNKNLLLSEGARIDTKPQLEIRADDVKCTHGSTVGQLDQDQVFYLRSRGVGLDAARNLLTYAFASEMVHCIRVQPIRANLDQELMTRLWKR